MSQAPRETVSLERLAVDLDQPVALVVYEPHPFKAPVGFALQPGSETLGH